MKMQLLKRLEEAEQNVETHSQKNFRRICKKMTTAELEECLNENTPDKRFWAIFKEASQR